MQILSFRSGFASDHSSTSYQFLAVDKPLGEREREDVATLPVSAAPSARRVRFVFPGEDGDIPDGWLHLMADYYDVMYREEYDWWTLAVAFNTTEEHIEKMQAYACSDGNGAGVSIMRRGNRAIIAVDCWIDYTSVMDSYDESEENYKDIRTVKFSVKDRLLRLLMQVRRQLIAGDYRALYAILEVYDLCDDEIVPVPPDRSAGQGIIEQFRSILVVL
ncbi:MAG: hypothetical protein SCM11_14475 [Bacillota bacterium]|nr:hypothetical protein [Bacillota bacterium]